MSVRFALLGLLAQRPRHGYELHAAFEALVGGEQVWDVKPAQIYTTLERLEGAGLVSEDSVEQAGGPEKRLFALTEAGRQELIAWLQASVGHDLARDEFFLKLMLALVTGEASPYALIRAQRTRLFQDLHTVTAQRSACDPGRELARILLFDKAGMHLEADLRWLDMLEGRLDEIRRQPVPEPEVKPRGRPRRS